MSQSANGPATPAPEETSTVRWLIETALLILLAFALAQGIKTFLVAALRDSDRIDGADDRHRQPRARREDHRSGSSDSLSTGTSSCSTIPTGQHPQLIKRVIAVGGQTVDVKDGAVWVDGKRLIEPYIYGKPNELGTGERCPSRSPWARSG